MPGSHQDSLWDFFSRGMTKWPPMGHGWNTCPTQSRDQLAQLTLSDTCSCHTCKPQVLCIAHFAFTLELACVRQMKCVRLKQDVWGSSRYDNQYNKPCRFPSLLLQLSLSLLLQALSVPWLFTPSLNYPRVYWQSNHSLWEPCSNSSIQCEHKLLITRVSQQILAKWEKGWWVPFPSTHLLVSHWY